MVQKKSPQANLENKKTVALLLGFVFALSMIYIAFEWSNEKVTVHVALDEMFIEIDQLEIPNTIEKVTPPPPPAPIVQPPITDYTPVDDNKEVADNNFISDNFDAPIEIPTYVPVIEDVDDIPVPIAEFMPEFKGNLLEFLSKNIKYPPLAIDNNIQGKVICQFVVNRDGSIEDIQVVRGVDPMLDKEAVRVIAMMPNWKPGLQNGKTVRVKFTLPVTFKLEK